MKKKYLLTVVVFLIIAMSSIAQETGTFTDSRDGKAYKTVKIGTQTWMAENLAYLPGNGNSVLLSRLSIAYDNLESNVAIYGYLYDWETAKLVAPIGWHLPSDIEWNTLIDFLGGIYVAGGKLKESDSSHWYENTGATNQSGFTAIPGGFSMNGTFRFSQVAGFWWSSTEQSSTDAGFINLAFNGTAVTKGPFIKDALLSVRCIRD